MTRPGPAGDGEALRSWVMERADSFSPLHIVEASAVADEDSDGHPTFILTLLLEPPPGDDETWPIQDVLALDRAVRRWGLENGYASGPHVHLQSTDPADAA